MKTKCLSPLHSIGKVALLAAFFVLPVTFVHAKEKPQKHRGHIASVDVEGKSLTLEKKKGDVKVVMWDDNTALDSTIVTEIAELKPGMWVRCIMVDQSDVIGRIRHFPEQDKAPGEDKDKE